MAIFKNRQSYLFWMGLYVSLMNSTTVGYDQSMMNGLQILPSYTEYFGLTTATLALNVAIVFLGAVLGTPLAGWIPNRWGRKWGLAATSFIAIVGIILQGAAVNEPMFCIGRLLIGVSINTGGVAAPAYLAEVAHPKDRELLVGLWGSATSVGSIIAALITFGTQYILNTWSWRIPSICQLIPALLCLAPLPWLPESPRWLIYQDRHEEAKAMITEYHGNGDPTSAVVQIEYEEVCQAIEIEKATKTLGFKSLLDSKPNRRRFHILVWIAIGTQFSGGNIVQYYLGTVLTTAGITTVQTQLGINVGIAGFTFACCIAGSYSAMRVGRRPSFIICTATLAFLLIIITILTKIYLGKDNVAASAGIVALIFLFSGACSSVWAPVSGLYVIEVLPFSLRSNGFAALNFMLYTGTFFNTYVIPFAMRITWGFYLITAGWCIVECIVMYFLFPETQGMNLEEVNNVFEKDAIIGVDKIVGELDGEVQEVNMSLSGVDKGDLEKV